MIINPSVQIETSRGPRPRRRRYTSHLTNARCASLDNEARRQGVVLPGDAGTAAQLEQFRRYCRRETEINNLDTAPTVAFVERRN